MYQDILATFDDKRVVTSAALGGGIFSVANSPNLGTSSHDTSAKGVPTPAVAYPSQSSGGPIGGTLLHDIGRGRKVLLVVQVTTTMTASGGAATLKVDFICSDAEDGTGNKTILISSDNVAKANLLAGYRFDFGSIPGKVPRRFVNVQYTVVTSTIDAGNISAFLALSVDDHADIIGSV